MTGWRGTGGAAEGEVDGAVVGTFTTTDGVGVSNFPGTADESIFGLLSSARGPEFPLKGLTEGAVAEGLSSFTWLFLFFPGFPSPNTLPLGVTTLSTKLEVVNFPLTAESTEVVGLSVVAGGTTEGGGVGDGSSTVGVAVDSPAEVGAGLVVPLDLPPMEGFPP